MKPYLIDVPVKINIWIRPNCQKKQWDVIRKVRPSILFLQSDGGRNKKEWEAILQNRKMIDDSIDWECKVYRIYEDHNNGLYLMGKKVQSIIWDNVDRIISLEDDQVPSLSFFRFCHNLLEKYKDDERIECICGFNHCGTWNCSADYFFSRQGAIWGTATWKRVYKNRELGFDYGDDPYVMSLLKQRTSHNRIAWKRLNAYSKSDIYEGHVAGGEFWKEFDMYSQNMLQIVPKKNMIKNLGYGKDSAHIRDFKMLPKSIRNLFDSEIYEIDFPINHAKYVIPDVKYEIVRNRIMHYNECWLRRFLRRIKNAFVNLFTHPKLFFHRRRGTKTIEK